MSNSADICLASRLLCASALACLLCACGAPDSASTAGGDEAAGSGAGAGADTQPDPALAIDYSQPRQACSDRQPYRKALFGDLHVHTTFSFDAYAYGVQTTPDDAYRFARGEPIAFLPLDDSGAMSNTITIDRPLDFLAVTDHAEFLGEFQLCTDPGSASFDSKYCEGFRTGGFEAIRMTATALALERPMRISPVCPQGSEECLAASSIPWKQIVAAAEAADDKTADCSFTALVGYEYSGSPGSSNYHRNVIFRSATVPAAPVSKFEAPFDYQLWRELNAGCRAEDGCDYLTIPHNSNLSNGKLLAPYADLPDTREARLAYATERLAREPLMEIFQHKGSSECANGFPGVLGAPDELCELEQIRRIGTPGKTGRVWFADGQLQFSQEVDNPTVYCEEGEVGFGAMQGNGCLSRNDFFRTALLTGLSEQNELGLNPVKLGASANTDTHMSTAGAVKESTWRGHIYSEWSRDGRLLTPGFIPSGKDGNPGGLTGVWAIENSRDAIFDAMKRREVFGTSGPRIQVRLFAGWDYPAALCEAGDMLAQAYTSGVPMGADLAPAMAHGHAPALLVLGLRDPDADAAPLQKLQVIKGWIDADGGASYKVYDVAGDTDPDAGVDMTSGERYGDGHSRLCTVFTDPDFDPAENAYYYARAVENPSPRWSLTDCLSYPPDQRPDVCDDPLVAAVIQEQAWTSPIWYTPL